MDQAVAGIKGTTFVVSNTAEVSSIKVIEGTVEFKSLATGKIEIVGAGEKVAATSAGLSPKEQFDVSAESAAWEKVRSDTGVAGSNSWYYIVEIGALFALILFVLKRGKQ